MKYHFIILLFFPICLYANIINVNHDGSGDYTTIQEGIDNANPGDTVLVFPGNYIETIDFLGKDIVVGSLYLTTWDPAYIESAIIDGDNSIYQLVKFTNGETEDARLVGFTITNAGEPSSQATETRSWGMAITISNSSPVIEHNRIIDNHYVSWYYLGGGIGIENSSAKILNNVISNNDGAFNGAGVYIKNSYDIVIDGNIISDHELVSGYGEAYGSAIYIESSQNIKISGNEIFNNDGWGLEYGGGMAIFLSEDVLICDNELYENRCSAGSGIYTQESEVTVIGNLIHDNHPGWGAGGVYFHMSDVLMVNNTICDNMVTHEESGWGGGMACSVSNIEVYNTIFYNNYASNIGSQIYIGVNADPDFFHCNIEGGLDAFGLNDTVTYDGVYENNIDLDPQFFLSGDHPYALDFNSPCINAGSPDTTGLLIPEYDLAGFDRIVQGIIDIGAYENQSHVSVPESQNSNEVSVFPNPTSGKITISLPEIELQDAVITVEDLKGNEVFQTELNNCWKTLDLSSLTTGVYLLRVRIGKEELLEKIVMY